MNKSKFSWAGTFSELIEFTNKHLHLGGGVAKVIDNENKKTIKSDHLTLNWYESTGTLQVQGSSSSTCKTFLNQLIEGTKGIDFPAPCLLDASDEDGATCHQTWSDIPGASSESANIVTKSLFAQELEKIWSEIKILNAKLTPNVEDIYSFIEIKVKDVCRLEIDKLKLEASSSYSNETIASLREENNLLNARIQELESRYESVTQEARSLSDENKSLMTVIRLLGKESQAATEKERINSASDADNKDLQEKLKKLEFCHSILKREDNSLREENKSLLTAIRLVNNEFQNPNEKQCSHLHDQICDDVYDMSPGHNKESSWVTVNNEKTKQRRKRKCINKSRSSTNANPTEPSRPTVERNQTSHNKRGPLNAAQQTQNTSTSDSGGNPTIDHTGKKKLVFIAGDSIIQHVQGWKLSTSDKHVAVKSFSGARIADMDDYLKPLLRKEPDEVILHVGTNNIHDESSRSVAEGIREV